MQRPNSETVTLNDILITQELSQRAPRPPNWQVEAEAMRSLAQQMARDAESLMQTLVDTAVELCQAGTAGVSLLDTTPDGEEIFRWDVLAGTLAHFVGSSTPRNFSLCGVCLEQGSPVLFSHPERYFTYFQDANTPIVEGLVLPLIADSYVFGTIWIMSHNQGRHFDLEDVRVLTSLADFTATALLLQQRQTRELLAANAALEIEIAERKHVEERTNALISSLPGGAVFVVDRDLRYLLAEGEALSVAGFKPEDFVGRTIFEALPPELITNYEALYRQGLAGEPFEYEHSAHDRSFISRGTPLRSPDGNVYAVLAVSYDITDRKRIEDERQQAEAAIAADLRDTQLLQDLSARLVTEADIQVLYNEILTAAIALMQADAGSLQVLDEATQELVLIAIQGSTPMMAEYFRRVDASSNTPCGIALATGQRTFTDFDVPESEDPDGSLRLHRQAGFLSAQSTPLISRSGKPIGMFSTHWRKHYRPSDSSELGGADRELRFLDLLARQAADLIEQWQAEQTLRESEAKYRSLFNSMDEGFHIVELIDDETGNVVDYRFLEANQVFERQTGLKDAVGKLGSEIAPRTESYWLEAYDRVSRTGEPLRIENYNEDTDRWYSAYASRVDGMGSRQVAIIFDDITERKRAEESLRESEEQQAFLLKFSDALRAEPDADAVANRALQMLSEQMQLDRCYIGVYRLADDCGDFTHQVGNDRVPPLPDGVRLSDFPESLRVAFDRTLVINDIAEIEGLTDTDRQSFSGLGLRALVAATLRKGENNPLWSIVSVSAHPRRWTRGEIALVEEVTERTWAAMERARAEAALRESEEKYRSLFNSIDDGFCIIERVAGEPIDFRYLEANPAFAVQTGISNVVGKTIRETFPNAPEAGHEIYENVLKTGEPIRFEIDVSSLDSPSETLRDRTLEIYTFRIEGESRLAVIFKDITKRKQSEVALRYAAEMDAFRVKLSDALRSLTDPVQIQTQACCLLGEHLGVDRAYYVEIHEAEGYARVNQHYSRGDSPSIVGDYRLVNYGWSLSIMRRGETIIIADTQTTDIIPDAERAAMAMITMIGFAAVPLIKGEVLVGALTVNEPEPREWSKMEIELIRETAERIWATIERAQAEAALRESEIQRIREQSAREEEQQRAEALVELDRAKTLFFSNISHEFRTPLTLLLAPLQDALSDRTHPLGPIHREGLELAHRNGLRLLKLVNTLLDFSRIEAKRIEAVYEPTDLAQFTADLASVFRSAIKRAGLRLIVDCPPLPAPVYIDREMWEKIVLNLLSNALKFTFKGEITVSLSAELSTNLQASTSNTHHLTSEPQRPSSELETSSSELETSTSKLETSTSKLETSTFNPETSSSKLETSTSKLETSGSELDTSGSELESSHTNPHTPTPSHPHTPTHVVLEIRDTGSGIPPEHLPHLFERFYQIRGVQARTHEGSGIGLALVNELVQLQGGAIAVSSTVGEGTCFTITLPFGTAHLPSERIQATRTLTSTALSADPYVQEAERWLPEGGNGEWRLGNGEEQFTPHSLLPTLPPAHVLIVDDNADMREYLTRILSEYVQVEAFADGELALSAIQTQAPDLVLSDVMMPGLDGFGLLQTLRADPRTREIPVILLSARAGEEAIAEGLEAGADDYLIKPFSAQELISRVNAHLQMSSLRGEALHEARTTIRRKDELLSVVSHELNTPLVSILGWARLLRANPQNVAMLSKALDTIERSAMMQARLVQDLLDVSRITAGKLRLHLRPLNLESVVEGAIATVTQLAAEKGIHLTCAETVEAVVMGDRERLQQVICNLLTNSIKFTPEGGRVEVCLSFVTGQWSFIKNGQPGTNSKGQMTNDNYAEICVTDTGIGISPDFLPHVFEQFRQAGGTNSAKGLGLGLAIAHHIVELHNGTIQAQSVGTGQGATFIVRFPLLKTNH